MLHFEGFMYVVYDICDKFNDCTNQMNVPKDMNQLMEKILPLCWVCMTTLECIINKVANEIDMRIFLDITY